MIERLLAADAALDRDDLDLADKLFQQVVEADPRNAIAVVGLGRVAQARGDLDDARALMARALEIDPDEAAAQRHLAEMTGGAAAPLTHDAPPPAAPPAAPAPAPEIAAQRGATLQDQSEREPAAEGEAQRTPDPTPEQPRRRSLVDRLLGLLGLRRRGS